MTKKIQFKKDNKYYTIHVHEIALDEALYLHPKINEENRDAVMDLEGMAWYISRKHSLPIKMIRPIAKQTISLLNKMKNNIKLSIEKCVTTYETIEY